MTGNFNRIYHFSRVVLQIQQTRQNKGIVIDLFPQIVVAVANRRIWFGLGFEWLTGSVNFGIMRLEFLKDEKERLKFIVREADKAGLTVNQYQRWNP